MRRQAINDLIEWKDSPYRKPLIIRGARQVGKTWLMKEFGRTQYQKCAYINFDNNERMESLFSGNLDIHRIITALQIEAGVTIEAENTLIIFDEVQEVPRALTSLKYFYENAPEYHVLAAGSLLGVALHPGTSFPVGKVDFLDLYPLDFLEFLEATSNGNLAQLLREGDFSLITTFKGKYLDSLKQYYYIGGMPEAVSTFILTQDYTKVREIQNRLLMTYEQDFSKHAPNETVPRIRMLWNSIPAQLAKENRKFVYGLIRQGARAREYELALQWLLDCGLVYKVHRVTKPDMPLMAYQDFHAFKLFILDVGLLAALSRLDLRSLLEGNRVFEEFKGALTEQYVLQQLVSGREFIPFYWSAEKGSAEVDFIFQSNSNIIPLEVKASENLQAKSLKSYFQKYQPKVAFRTSMSDFRKEEWLTNVPLYAINWLNSMSF
ncbi:ATP-binding protein [Paradesulfitobacterium ferrireducens]|uniref:ATP-binding protein n=1 Tax=Paradesulfitobacterium ferrireducens TaxID=2816476 RepID=UPI001A8C8483|nr:ATP-binding protein [Paradesulfitobacterium ferrireducens]